MAGPILETCAIMEVLKTFWHNGQQAPLFYYRDKDKQEIDLLISKDRSLYPVEVKKSASPSRDDCKNFHLLRQLQCSIGHGAVICLAQQLLPITSDVSAVPLSFI